MVATARSALDLTVATIIYLKNSLLTSIFGFFGEPFLSLPAKTIFFLLFFPWSFCFTAHVQLYSLSQCPQTSSDMSYKKLYRNYLKNYGLRYFFLADIQKASPVLYKDV